MIKVVEKMKELNLQILNSLISNSRFDLIMKLDSEDFNVLFEGSPILSSTAIGYVIESYVSKRCLKKLNNLATNRSPYDLKYEFDDYILLINIKTRTKDSSKSGIAAYGSLLSDMKELLCRKPVYYYVYEIEYKISEDYCSAIFCSCDYYCLNNYLVDKKIVTDSRSWGNKSSAKSGRILVKDFIYSLDNIPTPEQTKNAVCELLSYSDEEILSLREKNRKQKKSHLEKLHNKQVQEIMGFLKL